MHAGYRRRPGLAEQWRTYGRRPPVARWASRASLVLGVAVTVVMLLAATALAVKLLWHAWLWLWASA